MPTPPQPGRENGSRWKRLLRSWQLPVVLLLLVFAGLACWLIPSRIDTLATLDGSREWDAGDAPPQHRLVWQPAEAMTAIRDAAKNRPEFRNADWIRPHLTDGGGTLYFTLRPAKGDADIYVSRFQHGRWQTPQPVTEWNTPGDDIGPAISRDGREAYFYSNRPGGHGGFDLYVSRFEKGAWSKPANLGRRINTPAHEYDPAIAPDGLRLYFSSNRSDNPRETKTDKDRNAWPATMRANPGRSHFDLYATNRDRVRGPWSRAVGLKAVNRADSNEGAPAISPDGETLYFASDRNGGRGGFDLYRAALHDGEPRAVRNLGNEVNGPHDDLEPAVSPEGFTLVFSSDRDDPGGRYRLFQSRNVEVKRNRRWDDSNWRAFVAVSRDIWPWVLLTSAVLLVLLLAWRRYSQQISETTLAARFLLCSVVVHLLLLLLAGVATIGKAILDERNDLRNDIAAATIDEAALRESHKKGLAAFEKLADLKAIEQAAIPPKRREIQEAPNVPRAANNLRPTIPAKRLAKLTPERVILVRPDADPRPARQAKLRRRPGALNARVVKLSPEKVDLKKAAVPRKPPVANRPVVPPRQPKVPQPPARGMNVARDVPGRRPGAVPRQPKNVPSAKTAPKTLRLARRTIRHVTPVKPNVDKGEANKLAKTNDAPEKPVNPGPANAPPSKAASLTSPKPATELALRSGRPSSLTTKPAAAKAAPGLAKARRLPGPARGRVLPFEPAGVTGESGDTKLARNDAPATQPKSPPSGRDLPRTPPKAAVPVVTPKRAAGPTIPRNNRLIAGKLSKQNRTAPPVFGKRSSKLPRRLARAAPVAFAGDGAGLRRMLLIREPQLRKKLLPLLGATKESEAAVDRGLHWLARHQFPDGHWSLNEFHKMCKGHKKCGGRGHIKSDTAGTAFGLLPFLGRGQTHKKGEYRRVIDRGLKWLIKHQKRNGDLFTGGSYNAYMYSHGIATIALCEAYALSRDPQLKRPAQRAVDFIVKAQNRSTGGWRYKPGERGDTSVVGWQVMALKSGEMAGLNVPASAFQRAGKWLDSVQSRGRQLGRYGYANRGGSLTMTAEAILCRQFLGVPRSDRTMRAGADFLETGPPRRGKQTSYYWYYATQVMYHLRGGHWKKWNGPMRDLLRHSQLKSGGTAGSWNPDDNWERQAGRLYATSLRLLILEVYYRHLPLYDHLGK